jgi:ubiquinone biosynthesis protein COQ9
MPLPPPPVPDRQRLLTAILPHVPFDGWSDAAFRAACRDEGFDPARARALCPRGAADLAADAHRAGDRAMIARLAETDLAALRFRDRVALALRLRLDAIPDREVVRRATALFALPQNAPTGAALVWGTADAIWTALGDRSEDLNWYSKRAILSGVWAATVLYWLGDDSDGAAATGDFIDRRIADVMRFEEGKARVRNSSALRPFAAAMDRLAARVRAPAGVPPRDLPGYWPEGGRPE